MRISLIIATLGRAEELERLFRSLHAQQYGRLECLVVDQNPDDRLVPLLTRWGAVLPLRHLRCAPGLSRARNFGLEHVTGDIIAFPDDDCWYPPGLLHSVAAWFSSQQKYNILTVGACDDDGQASGNRWIQAQCELHPRNVFRTTFSSTIFVRRSSVSESIRFDPSLGVGSGTCFSSGEETDYVLRLMRSGEKGWFTRRWHIGHPKRDMLSGTVDARRACGYGSGMGYVLRRHSLRGLCITFLGYDLLRALLVGVRGQREAASLCWHHAKGIAQGYRAQLSLPGQRRFTMETSGPSSLSNPQEGSF